MAKRDYLKIIEATKPKLTSHYEMTMNEWAELATKAEKYPCEAIADAFVFGYAMGERAHKAKHKAKKPCQCANTDRAAD